MLLSLIWSDSSSLPLSISNPSSLFAKFKLSIPLLHHAVTRRTLPFVAFMSTENDFNWGQRLNIFTFSCQMYWLDCKKRSYVQNRFTACGPSSVSALHQNKPACQPHRLAHPLFSAALCSGGVRPSLAVSVSSAVTHIYFMIMWCFFK